MNQRMNLARIEVGSKLQESNNYVLKSGEQTTVNIPIPQKFGKFIKQSGNYKTILDTSFKFKNEQVYLKPSDISRTFGQKLNKLRSSNFSLYIHCPKCFLEQRSFEKNHPHFDGCKKRCHKCGLPFLKYISFEENETFCSMCSLMNGFDFSKHGRCFLHGNKGNKDEIVGSLYCVFKNKFSTCNFRTKKKNEFYSLKKELKSTEINQLNNALRYEYFSCLKNLIGIELYRSIYKKAKNPQFNNTKSEILILQETANQFKTRKAQLTRIKNEGNLITYPKHYRLSLDFSKIKKKNADRFVESFSSVCDEMVSIIDFQIQFMSSVLDSRVVLVPVKEGQENQYHQQKSTNQMQNFQQQRKMNVNSMNHPNSHQNQFRNNPNMNFSPQNQQIMETQMQQRFQYPNQQMMRKGTNFNQNSFIPPIRKEIQNKNYQKEHNHGQFSHNYNNQNHHTQLEMNNGNSKLQNKDLLDQLHKEEYVHGEDMIDSIGVHKNKIPSFGVSFPLKDAKKTKEKLSLPGLKDSFGTGYANMSFGNMGSFGGFGSLSTSFDMTNLSISMGNSIDTTSFPNPSPTWYSSKKKNQSFESLNQKNLNNMNNNNNNTSEMQYQYTTGRNNYIPPSPYYQNTDDLGFSPNSRQQNYRNMNQQYHPFFYTQNDTQSKDSTDSSFKKYHHSNSF